MSAPYCIVFVGVRYRIRAQEIEAFEKRRHPMQPRARQARLKAWWDRPGPDTNEHYLLVGDPVANLCAESIADSFVTEQTLTKTLATTRASLGNAHFAGKCGLHAIFVPD